MRRSPSPPVFATDCPILSARNVPADLPRIGGSRAAHAGPSYPVAALDSTGITGSQRHDIGSVAYKEDLADRLRELIGDAEEQATEKKMFGDLAFSVNAAWRSPPAVRAEYSSAAVQRRTAQITLATIPERLTWAVPEGRLPYAPERLIHG